MKPETLDAAAKRTVKRLEEIIFEQCVALGRYDLLDAIRDGGYRTQDDGGDLMSIWVGSERVLQVRVGPESSFERLN